jgi:hypothetical protein
MESYDDDLKNFEAHGAAPVPASTGESGPLPTMLRPPSIHTEGRARPRPAARSHSRAQPKPLQ